MHPKQVSKMSINVWMVLLLPVAFTQRSLNICYDVNIWLNTENFVFDLEQDLFVPGNILFVDSYSLKSSNSESTDLIVGSATEAGYQEGQGQSTRFKSIFGFTQLNSTTVIVADGGNHCIRFVDRSSKTTSHFTGQCTSAGYRDGNRNEAQFNFPYGLLVQDSRFIVSDSFNSALRIVDFSNGFVSTWIKPIGFPKAMITYRNSIFLTANYSISKINTQTNGVEILTSTVNGFKDGPLAQAQFEWPTKMAWIVPGTLLVAVDNQAERLRLISLKRNSVSSICPSSDNVCSHTQSCPPTAPQALIIKDLKLYVGINRTINAIELC